MQVKELKKEGLNHEIEVRIPSGDIDKRIDSRLEEVGKTIKLPGFRPGKVPMPLLKKRYGKSVLGEVLEIAVNDTTVKVLEDKGLKPAVRPKIEVKEFDEGKDLVYTMAVEVLPDFEVAEFKGLTLDRPVAKVEKKAIDEALERIAKQNRGSAPIADDRAAKEGDIVLIDFEGRTGEGVAYPGMSGKGHKLELGGGQFIPGFEDQLVGAKTGGKVDVKVTFPDPYQMKDLAGKDAIFTVTVHEIHEPADAVIDDEFAKGLGFDDLAALTKVIEEQMQKEYDGMSRMKVKRALLDRLDEMHSFEIPQGMLDMEYESILRQVEHEQGHSHDHDDPDHVHGPDCDHGPTLSDEEKDELKGIANRRVRLGLVLAEIGKVNNIQVTDQELQRAVIREAQRYPGQERQVFEFFQKNRQALENLRAPIFEEKVVDFILELSKVNEIEVTPEELAAEEEDEAKTEKAASGKKKAGAKKEKAEDSTEAKAEKKEPAKKSSKKKAE